MGQTIECVDGSLWEDPRETLDQWVERCFGRETLLMAVWIERTEKSVDLMVRIKNGEDILGGETYKVPDEVMFSMRQLQGHGYVDEGPVLTGKEELPF